MSNTSRLKQYTNPARSPIGLGILAGLTAVLGGLLLAVGGPLAGLAAFFWLWVARWRGWRCCWRERPYSSVCATSKSAFGA
ncbi:MAG: hypothetical protein P8183_19610 [Anaerolineae bacterium]